MTESIYQGAPSVWPLHKRIAFRAAAIYLPLTLSGYYFEINPFLRPWLLASAWFGEWLGIEEMFLGRTTSGDATRSYVHLLMCVGLTVFLTVVWSVLDRKRRAYPTAARWLVAACRYYLAITMVGYGLGKLYPGQFSASSLERLLTPFADLPPMQLLWVFMGYSPAYQVFGGAAEVLGGVLLLVRRTRLLGAMILAAVLSNVVMLNLAYDVSVKLYSIHLFAMSVGLVLIDIRRLVALFVLNRPVPAADLRPLFKSRRLNLGAKSVALAFFAWVQMPYVAQVVSYYAHPAEPLPLQGAWVVDSFAIDGENVPPLADHPVRWRGLLIGNPDTATIWRMDGSFDSRETDLDHANGTITIAPRDDGDAPASSAAPSTLRYRSVGDQELVLEGQWEGENIAIVLRKRALPLLDHGFHWIHERPPGLGLPPR